MNIFWSSSFNAKGFSANVVGGKTTRTNNGIKDLGDKFLKDEF